MPNIKSAKKRMRTSEKRHEGNRAAKSRLVTEKRKFYDAILAGDAAVTKVCFNAYCSVLDKAVKRGALKANAADRRKSRANLRMQKATA
jgi:small subunit ribosomal protein S20